MVVEKQLLEQLKSKLMGLGYPRSALKTEVSSLYGKRIDLVVYESRQPRIVFELKAGMNILSVEELGFHPTVRQAQSLAQEIDAPYFAVFDGNTIFWFDIDKEQGRPRLLQTPILPISQEAESESIEDNKSSLLRLLFFLYDVGRSHFLEPSELITHIGLTLLARLWSETGDERSENLLIWSNHHPPFIDSELSDLDITQNANSQIFYRDAFSLLDRVELSKIEPSDFLAALDDFIQFSISRDNYGIFKLPTWISEIFAHLAQLDLSDEILDMYSNFGDGVAAVGKTNNQTRILSVTPNAVSYLWDKLKRVVLGLNPNNVVRIYGLDEYRDQTNRFAGQLNKILVSPPFGIRLREGSFSGRSEDLFLELALNWIRPGGRVVALVPESLLISSKREAIRHYIFERAWIRSIISLNQFMPGTSIKASIIVLDKKSPNSLARTVMMCKVLDKDVQNLSDPRRSISSSKWIQKILEVYNTHVQNGSMPNEKGIWFIPSKDLDIKSWAVSYYDPEKEVQISSQYPTKHLQELAVLKKGSPLTLDKIGPLLVIGPGAVRALSIDPTKLDRTTKERLSPNPIRAKVNDVLIHAVGPNRGQAATVGSEFEDYFISRNIIVLHPVSPLILSDYLAIILNSSFIKKQLEERSTGSVIRQLTIRRLKDLLIPVPDISTQRLIIEKVIDAQQKLVEIEQQAIVIESSLKEQQNNLQNILDSIHLGGGENA